MRRRIILVILPIPVHSTSTNGSFKGVQMTASVDGSLKISPAKGKLAVLTPGMGAVATTFFAGVEAVKRGLAKPIGSYTQMGELRLGKRTEKRFKKVNELVPLAELNDLVFGGWDLFPENSYE